MTSPLATATPDHWSNFLWALASPDIAPEYPLPWLPSNRRADLSQYFSVPEIRIQLEDRLLALIQQIHSRRLGIYFENLWTFAFTHHPDYELLARNFPIRDQGRTLGELDFVVRYKPDNLVEHWEVALKYYLQVDDYWVGPGLKDRLDIKLDRMRDHQLPIAQNAVAKRALADADIALDRQWALMPGRLFRPFGDSATQLLAAGEFWWADLAAFLRHVSESKDQAATRFLQLPKTCWLAPGAEPLTLEYSAFEETQLARGPICVGAGSTSGESNRGFLVPDNWLGQARQGL